MLQETKMRACKSSFMLVNSNVKLGLNDKYVSMN